MLEKELRANWDSVFYPEPEPQVETFGEEVQPVDEPVLLAAGPSGTVSDAGAGMAPGRPVDTIKPFDPTIRQQLADFLQAGFERLGASRNTARKNAQTIMGGGSSNLPIGMGLADIVPFLGTALQTEEAAIAGGEAVEAVKRGDLGEAGVQAGMAAVGMIPGAAGTVRGARTAIKGAQAAGKALAPKAGEMVENYLTKSGAILKVAPDVPAIEVPAAGDITKPAFKRWFGDSKVVDDSGKPKVMYHGTVRNFEAFDPSRSPGEGMPPVGAMFFTDDPKFAEEFARAPGVGTTGANLMPVYVQAKNPFDYDNPAHRSAVIDLLMERVPLYKSADDQTGMRRVIDADIEKKDGTANWGVIEAPQFQQALKDLGFDAFYVREGGRKNLGVYQPAQVKSVFNKGTWNPNDPRILQGAGGVTATGAATQDKEQK